MANFERTIIDPSDDILAALCAERWSSSREWLAQSDVNQQLASQREGWCSLAEGRLLIAWWTDAIGRKHVRVASPVSTRGWQSTLQPPPLALVYPGVCC